MITRGGLARICKADPNASHDDSFQYRPIQFSDMNTVFNVLKPLQRLSHCTWQEVTIIRHRGTQLSPKLRNDASIVPG